MNDKPNIQPEINMASLPKEYLMCILKECPLSSHCLRYLAGTRQSGDLHVLRVINPNYHGAATDRCQWFRPDEKATMKQGMTTFFRDMPGHMENSIRNELIRLFGRTTYFKMRRGDLLITPEEQQQIAATCRKHGWQGELNYDGEVEDWLW